MLDNSVNDPTAESCPFCAIAGGTPASTAPLPVPPPRNTATGDVHSSSSSSPPPDTSSSVAHTILSTPHVLAFLDHAPMTRGHTLVIVRAHREKLADVRVQEGAMLGRWLGVVSRAVVGALRDVGDEKGEREGETIDYAGEYERTEEEDEDVGDWNVVQNNGARAAQVVPHVHFHIIPRVGDVPEVKARSWTVFGRGQREDLDEEDAEGLVRRMRGRLSKELERIKSKEGEGVVKEMFGVGDWERRWSKL